MAAIFGAPVTEPGGKLARAVGVAGAGARSAATSETSARRRGAPDPASCGTRTDPAAHAAEVVADEVDDHHVLGAVLADVRELSARAAAASRPGAGACP